MRIGKTSQYVIFAALLSFIINIFTHQQLWVSLTNSLIFILSWQLFKTNFPDVNIPTPLVIITLGVIPMLNFQPEDPIVPISLILSLSLLILYHRISFFSKPLFIITTFFIIFSSLFGTRIIDSDFTFNKFQTIFSNELISLSINLHRGELNLPSFLESIVYNKQSLLQTLVYNKLTVYLSYSVANLLNLINLKNLYDPLLIANLYPLTLGVYWYIRNFKQRKIILIWLIIILGIFSINKTFDKFSSLYVALPLILYFIFLGFSKIKPKIYLLLFIFSLFILLTPKL